MSTSKFVVGESPFVSIDSMILLLAGIFIGALFLSLIDLVRHLANDAQLPNMTFWLLGTLVGADSHKVAMIAFPTLCGGVVLMTLRWRLNLLSLGDLDAKSLGMNVGVLRWAIIGLVSLIVASQVAVSGLVGWIGLVVPHCARLLVGPDHRRLLPTAALLGALFVLALDDLTRAVLRAEIPVGALTAIFGTPVVCFLLWKSQGRGVNSTAQNSKLRFLQKPGWATHQALVPILPYSITTKRK